jgi:hypothetical protein
VVLAHLEPQGRVHLPFQRSVHRHLATPGRSADTSFLPAAVSRSADIQRPITAANVVVVTAGGNFPSFREIAFSTSYDRRADARDG